MQGKTHKYLSKRAILKLEEVNNGGFVFLEGKREKKREKMKRKVRGEREVAGHFGGAHSLLLSHFSKF